MKYSLDTVWKTIKAPFSQGGEFRRNPQIAWKAILVFFGLGVIAVLALGYLTYYRAVTEDDAGDAIVPRSALRTADVKAVLATYQQKKEAFNALLVNEPAFLSPAKGVAVVPKEETLAELASTSTSSEVMP